MKIFFFSGILFFLFIFSDCNQDKTPAVALNSPEAQQKAAAIDSFLLQLKEERPRMMGQKYNINLYSELDRSFFTTLDGQLTGIVVDLFPENKEVRSFFNFKDGKLVNYKSREWVKSDKPYAVEINCYIDDNGIYRIQERGSPLLPGQNPSGILSLPYQDSKLNADSMLQFIKNELARIEKASVK